MEVKNSKATKDGKLKKKSKEQRKLDRTLEKLKEDLLAAESIQPGSDAPKK